METGIGLKREGIKNKIETANQITESGLILHEKAHGRGDNGGEDNKPYHSIEHPEKLIFHALRIAELLNLDLEKTAILKMILAYHDTVIEYDKPPADNVVGMVKRHRGAREGDMPFGINGNEAMSAKLLVEKMQEAKIFTDEEIKNVIWAIDVTYPGVDMGSDFKGVEFKKYPYYKDVIKQNSDLADVIDDLEKDAFIKGNLFYQPHLEKELEDGKDIPMEVLIAALVDLGGAGCGESGEFFKEGDAEMREVYFNVRQPENLNRLMNGVGSKDSEDRSKIAEAFLNWSASQAGFATWQAIRFEKILFLLNKNEKVKKGDILKLKNYFSHYVQNIRAAFKRVENLRREYAENKVVDEKEAFVNLASKMGYKIPEK